MMRPTLVGLTALVVACGGGASRPGERAAPSRPTTVAMPGALVRFGAATVIVLPVQMVPEVRPASWRAALANPTAAMLTLDSLIEGALAARGLGKLWVFPPALQRAAKRNPIYLKDPYEMRVAPALALALRKRDELISEPAATQMRSFAGVGDARYALVPHELWFEEERGMGRGLLRVVIVDTRAAAVSWVGDCRTEPQSEYSRTVLEDLATCVAGLVVPR